MVNTGIGNSCSSVYVNAYETQKIEASKMAETKAAVSEQTGGVKRAGTDSVSISEEGKNILRETVGKSEPEPGYNYAREVTIQNTNEVAWEHYTAMMDISSQTLKNGDYSVEDVMKSIMDTYETLYNKIVEEHEKGDREVSYRLTGKRILTLDEDLAGLNEAFMMRKANLEGYITCQQTNKAFENPDSAWYFQRDNREELKRLPSINAGVYGIMNDFEKAMSESGEKGEAKTDTFDSYVRRMASAYDLMKNRIEEKYAAPGRQPEYYTASDGSTQELTKEKELEMLDSAYEMHSRFMATSTQIWCGLRDFKAQIEYHSGGGKAEPPAEKNHNAGIKEQAYNVFMSAVHGESSGLDRFHPNMGVLSSTRKTLNNIWDYFANLKH